jgi:hypothetical protein
VGIGGVKAGVWRIAAASVVGTAHAVGGTLCQDRHFVDVLADGTLVACLADGAGSASQSSVGAEIACSAWREFAEMGIGTHERFDTVVRERWVPDARAAIAAQAAADGLHVSEYACTFLGTIIRSGGKECMAHYLQIGDGAIVAGRAGKFECLFWPEQGEFANTTSFLTDAEPRVETRTNLSLPSVEEVALFSDGLQRLALDYGSKTAFEPFFDSMFSALRPALPEGRAQVSDWLSEFLNWEVVNKRTDDDKTLILATRKRVDGRA